jgi:hypothetical protein
MRCLKCRSRWRWLWSRRACRPFHDVELDTLRAALATVASCDLSGVYTETPAIDPARLPLTYLLPPGDRTLRPEWMAGVARERPGTEPIAVPGGHCPHVATPDAIAEIISEACAGC